MRTISLHFRALGYTANVLSEQSSIGGNKGCLKFDTFPGSLKGDGYISVGYLISYYANPILMQMPGDPLYRKFDPQVFSFRIRLKTAE